MPGLSSGQIAQEVVNGLTAGLGRWDKLVLAVTKAAKGNFWEFWSSVAGLGLALLGMGPVAPLWVSLAVADYFVKLGVALVALGLVLLLLPRPTRFAIAVRLQTVLLAPLRALENLRAETRSVRQENERLARLAAELALDQVADVLEAARLRAVAVDGQ